MPVLYLKSTGFYFLVYYVLGYRKKVVLMNLRNAFPEKTEEEHWQRASEIFSDRVFTYVSDGWIFLPGALAMAKTLEQEALRCLAEKSMDWPEPDITEIKN